jgi:hypothetical protein
MMACISGSDVKCTSGHSNNNTGTYKCDTSPGEEIRYNINRNATLAGIQKYYFSKGNIFMYPSQICDVFLIPQRLPPPAVYNSSNPDPANLTYDNIDTWWSLLTNNHPVNSSAMYMTGDNLREEPYGLIYPRVTTQSNTFTVHYRVQVLQKQANSNAAVWTEGQDKVVSEYRGSSLIERYIDPNDTNLNQNWDTNTINLTAQPGGSVQAGTSYDLSQLYKFRVLNTKKFAP